MDMNANDGGPGGAIHPSPGAVPLVAAIAAAAVGAGIWAAVAHFTGFEHGLVAWGVGILVGFAAAATGGRGQGLAVTCALLAVVAIFAGKYFSAGIAIDEATAEMRESMIGQEVYDEFIVDSQLVGGLETDTELKGFMIERGFTDASAVPEIAEEDFAYFRDEQLPDLRVAQEDPPTYDAWRQERRPFADEFTEQFAMTPMEAVKEDLSPIDIIFVLLGLVSAYKLVANKD